MPIFPFENATSCDPPKKTPKKRSKKTTNLAVDLAAPPSPIFQHDPLKNSSQTDKNVPFSPIFIPQSSLPQSTEVDFLPTAPISFSSFGGPLPQISTVPVSTGMSADTPAVALVCSDIHLSPAAPAARIEEPDWAKAMENQMLWLFEQAKEHDVPLVIAGDIFDKAIADSRFISFIIGLFRQCEVPIYAVPGNHDLPYHSYANMSESAYGILTLTDSIRNIDQTLTYQISNRDITLHGYHWARSFDDPPPFNPDHFNIAVIHKYIYDSTTGYFGADIGGRYDNQLTNIPFKYDFLVYGDNHTPFHKTTPSGQTLINCGSFFRRSQNDKHLSPAAYLLKLDRSFVPLYVPLEGQIFLQKDDELSMVSTSSQDFSELSSFFDDSASGIDNLTIRDSFRRFVASSNISCNVKDSLSRITGLALLE